MGRYVQPLQRALAKACVAFGHGLSLALLEAGNTFSIRWGGAGVVMMLIIVVVVVVVMTMNATR